MQINLTKEELGNILTWFGGMVSDGFACKDDFLLAGKLYFLRDQDIPSWFSEEEQHVSQL